MKKLISLIFILNSYLFSVTCPNLSPCDYSMHLVPGSASWNGVGFRALSSSEDGSFTIYGWTECPTYAQISHASSEYGKSSCSMPRQCSSPKVFNGTSCVCPSGTEPFSAYSCQTERYDDNFGCVTPCQAGYGRNLAGSCCPIGLDVFCNGDGTFSDCKCPDGSTMLEQSDGTFLCESGCPDGQILNSDGTCRCSYDAISNGSECTTCEFPYVATIQNECVDCGNNQTPDTNGICSNPCSDSFPYYFPISEDSTSKIIIPSGGNSQVCYDLGDNLEDTSGDNVSNSDTPDGTTTTTETTTNDDGTTTTTETTTETTTNDDGTTTTNTTTTTTESDGTSTSNTTSETSNKDERNYDKAFEDIGDEIIKNRNEIKKSSNKNSEDLQKIEDEIKKTNKKLSFDNTKIQDNFDPATSEKQFDETSFTSNIENKLNELQVSTTEKIDTVWNDIQTDVSNMVFIEVGTCQALPTHSMDFHGQTVTFISQDNFQIFFDIFRPIIIFIFTLSGLLYVYRAM